MGINVRVQKSPKPLEIIVAQANLERDLKSCMRCRFFYGNNSQCMEQRIVPTGMAVRDNEVKRHRNFSKKHFSGVAACGFRLVGHDGGAVRDEAVPVYVTRFGDSAKRQILENGGLVPLFSEIKKFVLLEG